MTLVQYCLHYVSLSNHKNDNISSSFQIFLSLCFLSFSSKKKKINKLLRFLYISRQRTAFSIINSFVTFFCKINSDFCCASLSPSSSVVCLCVVQSNKIIGYGMRCQNEIKSTKKRKLFERFNKKPETKMYTYRLSVAVDYIVMLCNCVFHIDKFVFCGKNECKSSICHLIFFFFE